MSFSDKISNKAQELSGKAKESAGDATNDDELKAEGLKDQAEAGLKQAGEKISDAAKSATEHFKK
ncbi:CsbD family protein [Zhihengliuella halotolerans]|uniref:CsbD-like protein n=1 Tax=Zhihengliuella halotolerans TaxID=370736 RepID=A0A4Q8AD97_9MICC|nr:CsbD family protein [Zhihengliuella halotolerans]RZU62202.1 CsbD-like protein [Zhihengliuella halotolerans]